MSEVSFGPFLLDPSSTRLLRDGVEVKLRPQAFQALRTLLRHSGQSIGYEQMMAEAWDGTFVSRHTVDVTIGEVQQEPRRIRTLDHPSSRRSATASRSPRPRNWFARAGTTGTAARARAPIAPSTASSARRANAARTSAHGKALSTCYLMLATFGMRAPRDVYPEFLEAHERAVDAGGLRPRAALQSRARAAHVRAPARGRRGRVRADDSRAADVRHGATSAAR